MNNVQWCIEQHTKTNHYYDQYLPYEFHLRMVVQVFEDFKHLLNDNKEYKTNDNIVNPEIQMSEKYCCRLACWGHDLIEDTRTSYNDVKEQMGEQVADIIYALTNEKGKNRKERANDKYYEGIINTPGAVFVKLCDRIANVQYSKMSKSRMFEMYKKENENFITSLGYKKDHQYKEMFNYLISLFE